MAKITVKFFATVREVTGVKSVEAEADTIGELMDSMKKRFGKQFEDLVIDPDTDRLKLFFACMVNGKRIELLEGFSTALQDGDTVSIFPPIGGG